MFVIYRALESYHCSPDGYIILAYNFGSPNSRLANERKWRDILTRRASRITIRNG